MTRLRGDPPKGGATEFQRRRRMGCSMPTRNLSRCCAPAIPISAWGWPAIRKSTPRRLARGGPRRPQAQGRGRGRLRHHPALLRQRPLFSLRRALSRGGHHRADRARSHARPLAEADPALHRHVRRLAAAQARAAPGGRRGPAGHGPESIGIDWGPGADPRPPRAAACPGYHLYILNRAKSAPGASRRARGLKGPAGRNLLQRPPTPLTPAKTGRKPASASRISRHRVALVALDLDLRRP